MDLHALHKIYSGKNATYQKSSHIQSSKLIYLIKKKIVLSAAPHSLMLHKAICNNEEKNKKNHFLENE